MSKHVAITLPMLVILMIPPAVHAKSGGKWKKHGVNPAGGGLPMGAQIPIFIALFIGNP